MSYKLVIQDQALLDIDVAFEWYEEQRVGLGEEFVEEVEDCFTLISNDPTRYGYFRGSNRYRRIFVSRFPYRVLFEIEGETIFITWVTHDKKNRQV